MRLTRRGRIVLLLAIIVVGTLVLAWPYRPHLSVTVIHHGRVECPQGSPDGAVCGWDVSVERDGVERTVTVQARTAAEARAAVWGSNP